MKNTYTFYPRILVLIISLIFLFTSLYGQWNWINPLPQGNHLNGISFVNDSVGWVVGDEGVILKTIDFGVTWEVQASDSALDLNDVYFVNINTGYIIGDKGYLLKTIDGGQTWEQIDFPSAGGNGSLFFIDEKKGWVTGDLGGYGNEPSIFATKDGGLSWTHFDFWTWDYVFDICFVDSLNGY